MHATDASVEALADFIDYQYGPGLRIVPAAEMDAKWTPESELLMLQGKGVPGTGIESSPE